MRCVMGWMCAVVLCAIAWSSGDALAQGGEVRVEEGEAFSREWALSGYLSGGVGDYTSGGVGGRLRYEPLSWLGVEVFAEALLVEWPTSTRHDYPIGFNLYAPWSLTPWLRLRPLAGMCAVFSFIEPSNERSPRADDVMFGLHAGAGVEVGLSASWSIFLDAQAVYYLGHDRASDGWAEALSESLTDTAHAQMGLGVQLHL